MGREMVTGARNGEQTFAPESKIEVTLYSN